MGDSNIVKSVPRILLCSLALSGIPLPVENNLDTRVMTRRGFCAQEGGKFVSLLGTHRSRPRCLSEDILFTCEPFLCLGKSGREQHRTGTESSSRENGTMDIMSYR